MCIQDSRRSNRTYAYATEFNLFGGTRRYHRDYGTYTGISEHILVLQNLYLYTRLILILQILYWYYRTYYYISDTEVPVGTTEHIPYTEVLVGTTGLILILRIREYS